MENLMRLLLFLSVTVKNTHINVKKMFLSTEIHNETGQHLHSLARAAIDDSLEYITQ